MKSAHALPRPLSVSVNWGWLRRVLFDLLTMPLWIPLWLLVYVLRWLNRDWQPAPPYTGKTQAQMQAETKAAAQFWNGQ